MLSFRIFADDTNVFASAHDLRSLGQLINTELKKVNDANKLSINFSKTNFMIVKSPKKKDLTINIKVESEDDTSSLLERKDWLKYLGVHLDDTVSFKHHISYVASRISRSNGIIAKLRHFLTLSQLRQLYYSIIYSYISYAILAWESACKTHIKKIQTKQNHATHTPTQLFESIPSPPPPSPRNRAAKTSTEMVESLHNFTVRE